MGASIPCKKGKCVKTSSAIGHESICLNLAKPYDTRKPEKVSASETMKNHIINLP